MVIDMNPDPRLEALKFREAIMKDPEFGETGWKEKFEIPAARNPVYRKALAEGLYSDVAGAVGGVNNVVVKAATPLLVSRAMIKVVPTNNAIERFAKEIRAYAFVTGEAPPMKTGARAEFEDVKADLEIACSQEWSESFAEDAGWNILAWEIEAIGKAIARVETAKVDALYEAIAAANLAGGAEKTITDGAPTWAQICDLIAAVESEDFHPNIIAMNPHEFGGLCKLPEFISSLYKGNLNLTAGMGSHTSLGVDFISSSLVVSTLAIDTDAAAAMIVRRNLTAKPYERPDANMYGVQASERIGMKILRSKAVARGTN
jgi:hypothetical protein